MAYNSIADNELRYPILELALHILFVNKNGQISINDPLEVIIRESSNSHTTPKDELLLKMASDRVEYGLLGELVPYMLTRQLLSDVPQHISSHKNLTLALMYLMSEQKSGDLNSLTRPILTPTWVESLSRSFIRADVSKNDRLTLELNPNYVIAAHYRILNELDVRDKTAWAKFKAEINTSLLEQSKFADLWQNLGLHSDWWRRLALLEALRTSLKFGKPLVCPYKGWQFEKFEVDALKNYPLKCDERCIIRYWLKKLKNRTEIVGSNATCEP